MLGHAFAVFFLALVFLTICFEESVLPRLDCGDCGGTCFEESVLRLRDWCAGCLEKSVLALRATCLDESVLALRATCLEESVLPLRRDCATGLHESVLGRRTDCLQESVLPLRLDCVICLAESVLVRRVFLTVFLGTELGEGGTSRTMESSSVSVQVADSLYVTSVGSKS